MSKLHHLINKNQFSKNDPELVKIDWAVERGWPGVRKSRVKFSQRGVPRRIGCVYALTLSTKSLDLYSIDDVIAHSVKVGKTRDGIGNRMNQYWKAAVNGSVDWCPVTRSLHQIACETHQSSQILYIGFVPLQWSYLSLIEDSEFNLENLWKANLKYLGADLKCQLPSYSPLEIFENMYLKHGINVIKDLSV